jgi:cytoskeletal protein RodZ
MSGKRAKPSPWRFLRLVPVALVAMAVCAMLGLFLLLQDPGDDQAHDWNIDPAPSDSREPEANGPESSPAGSPSTSTTASARPTGLPATAPQRDASPAGNQSSAGRAPNVHVKRAAATAPAPQPAPRVTRPPVPRPSVSASGPAKDNPGKKKGHRKGHGPGGHPHR